MKTVLGLILLTIAAAFGTPPPGYTLVFSSNLNGYTQREIVDGDGWGPIVAPVQFFPHTPYPGGGTFGSAYFTGQAEPNGDGTGKVPPNPFFTWYGELRIEQYYDPVINHWRSGIISTIDNKGNGFSQALGYWEARIFFPSGPGVWPAFWFAGVNGINPNRTNTSAEIDFECFGADPAHVLEAIHEWPPSGPEIPHPGDSNHATLPTPGFPGWHTLGLLVNPDRVHWYIDGTETFSIPTLACMTLPLYAMIDFAQSSPTGAISPNYLRIAYLKCWAP